MQLQNYKFSFSVLAPKRKRNHQVVVNKWDVPFSVRLEESDGHGWLLLPGFGGGVAVG